MATIYEGYVYETELDRLLKLLNRLADASRDVSDMTSLIDSNKRSGHYARHPELYSLDVGALLERLDALHEANQDIAEYDKEVAEHVTNDQAAE